MPTINSDLLANLNTFVEEEAQSASSNYNPFSELLFIYKCCEGFYLPVNFEIFPNYLQMCNSDYLITLGNPQYRQSLHRRLPIDYFDNPRIIKSESQPQPKPTIVKK